MLSFQEMLDKLQHDISSIADPTARDKAQSQFDLLPKDPKVWAATSSTTFLDYAKGKISGSASKEEIEAAYRKGVERDAEQWEDEVDDEQYENLKKRGDPDHDINFETSVTVSKPSDGTIYENGESYNFQISANQGFSSLSVQHNKGTAGEVSRRGKHKDWGTYDKETRTTRRPGTYFSQDSYLFTNSDKHMSKPKATDIYESATTNSFDENLKKEQKTKRTYTQFLDDNLHISKDEKELNKGGKTTTRTEETTYGPLMWDKTIKAEEKDNTLNETKVLEENSSHGFISDLDKGQGKEESANAEQAATVNEETSKTGVAETSAASSIEANTPAQTTSQQPHEAEQGTQRTL